MSKRIGIVIVAFVLALTAGLAVACSDVEVATKQDKSYTVTYYYNYDGAPNNGVYKTDKVNANTAAKKPSNPTRADYSFTEWTKDAAGQDAYNFATTVSADLKLYAQWKQNDPATAKLTGIQASVTKSYKVNDTFAKTDITVTAKYDDDTEKTVTDFEYTAPDMTTDGQKTITVTYGGKTTTVTITVSDDDTPVRVLTGISAVLKDPNKVYKEGDIFTKADITVTGHYSDETDGPITDFEIGDVDMSTAGSKTVKVSVEGVDDATVTFTVQPARTLTDIEVTNNKAEYTAGDPLDITVKAVYSDGTKSDPLSEGEYTFVTPYDKDLIGKQSVTIKYNGKTKTFEVTVKEAETLRFDMSFNANIAQKFVDKIVDMPVTKKVNQNSTTAEPDKPKLKGFTFNGWYKEAACINKWNFDTDTVTDDVPLYASWTAKTYTVNYVLKGGVNNSENPATYCATDADVTLKNATLDYHTSGGWYTAETGGTKVETLTYDSIPASATATEIKLYARYTPETYTIDYELGNSPTTYTAVLSADVPRQYTYGKTTTLPGVDDVTVTTAEGVEAPYVFMHWYVQGDANKTEVDNTVGMHGNKTFVALIEQKATYKFTFDYGYDHNGDGKTTYSRNIIDGEKANYRDLSTLNRVGYTFDGWFTDKDAQGNLTNEYDFNTTVTAEKTIYAKWTAINYTIVYSGAGVTTTNPTSYKITDAATTLSTTPTLDTGYYFDGWYFDAEYEEPATVLNSDIISKAVVADGVSTITIYAKSSNVYNVVYNTNRPKGVTESTSNRPENTTVVYGNPIADNKIPTLTDYACLGWYTAATCDCEGECTHKWDFDTEVTNATAAFDETHTLTLYARWYSKVTSGKYMVGEFNDWQNFDKDPNAASYKAGVVRTGKEWKLSGVTLEVGKEFKFIDYDKDTNKIDWNTPYDISVCNVRPGVAMTIEITKDGNGNPNNYKIATYGLDEGSTWTIEFGTNTENKNYITFTLDGYIDWRDPADGSPENPTVDLELEDDVWYFAGNFTYWFKQSESWSTKNAFSVNSDNYMFTKVYLKQYDTFKIMNKAGTWLGGTFVKLDEDFAVSTTGKDIELNTIEDGYYNIIFKRGENKLQIRKYVPITIALKANNPIYVGDVLTNNTDSKAHFTVTNEKDGSTIGEYRLLSSTAVAGENASTATVIYMGGVFTLKYTAKQPQITAISVNAQPTNKWYWDGDTLNTAGLKIKLDYDKNDMDQVVTDMSMFDFEYTMVGRRGEDSDLRLANTVTVTVKLKSNPDITTTFIVNVVNKVTSIAVTENPNKMEYYVGDALNTAGMVVTVYFNGGTELYAAASGTPTTSPANGAALKASDNKIVVTYTQYTPNNCTLTMPTLKTEITGLAVTEPQIEAVAVAGVLTKSTYKVGDTFSADGLTFTATKQNGATVSLDKSAMTFTFASEYANESNMFIKAGTAIPVTVTYGDIPVTGTVTVTVDNKPTGLSIDATGLSLPHAAGFVEGDRLSITGIKVYHIYNQGIDGATVFTDTVPVIHSNLTVTPALNSELTAGEKTVTVRCADNVKGEFTITVAAKVITGLTLKAGSEAAMQYKGSTFNSTGLTFVAHYNNDDTDEVTADNDVTFTCKDAAAMTGGAFQAAGTYTMVATYNGESCEFDVTVDDNTMYNVTFRTNITGLTAVGMPANQPVQSGRKATAPATAPTLKGYVFGGWYANDTCTTEWDFETEITDNRYIYAKWTAKTYTIVYDVDDVDDDTYAAVGKLFPAELTLKEAEKTGHDFEGWHIGSAEGDGPYRRMTYARLPANEDETSLTQTINLYAEFEASTYSVVFIANGDELEDEEQAVKYNAFATKPTYVPTRLHYTFKFWSLSELDAQDATEFDFATAAITEDTVLNAQWIAINYTVNYKDADGAAVATTNPATYGMADAASITLTNPTAPARKRFVEWRYNGAKVTALKHEMLPSADDGTIEIVAVFEDITYYTVTFDPNEGTLATDTQTPVEVEAGATVSKPANPSRTNWTFVHWYKDGDATEAEYTFDTPVNGNITLKAKWQRVTFVVTFDFNGVNGIVGSVDRTVNKGEVVVAPVETDSDYPVRTGWAIVGWFTDKACTTEYTFPPASMKRTVYAKWQKLTGAYLIINDGDREELTDNSESEYHSTEYMLAGDQALSLNAGDIIKFTVDNAPASFTVDTASHGIEAAGSKSIKITDDGTYSFYLYNDGDGWTLYATYAEYVDYYYLVGLLPNNDSYKWATVNPTYKLSAQNTITFTLEVNNEFKVAHADGNNIRWDDSALGFAKLTEESKAFVSGSDNIKITVKGEYTISVIQVNGETKLEISREGAERPDESGRVTVESDGSKYYLVYGTDTIDETKGVPVTINGGQSVHLDKGTKFKFINGTKTYSCFKYESGVAQTVKDALTSNTAGYFEVKQSGTFTFYIKSGGEAWITFVKDSSAGVKTQTVQLKVGDVTCTLNIVMPEDIKEFNHIYAWGGVTTTGWPGSEISADGKVTLNGNSSNSWQFVLNYDGDTQKTTDTTGIKLENGKTYTINITQQNGQYVATFA